MKSKKHGVMWVCHAVNPVNGIQKCLAEHMNGYKEGMCFWGPIGEAKEGDNIGGPGDGPNFAPFGQAEKPVWDCATECKHCEKVRED